MITVHISFYLVTTNRRCEPDIATCVTEVRIMFIAILYYVYIYIYI